MNRFECEVIYKFKKDEAINYLKKAVKSLGFTPQYMSIYFLDMKKPLDDISFDLEHLLKLINGKSGTVTIKQQLFDPEKRESNNWFRFKLIVDSPFGLDICSLEWSNVNLDFLLETKKIIDFIDSADLIYAYCYDQYDCVNQSDERVDSYIENYPKQPYKIIKNYMDDDVIDVSKHWGRHINIKGLSFMAAPLMWFGSEYFYIIPKNELLKLASATLAKFTNSELVQVKLFNLYEDPSSSLNRKKQEDFWKTMSLQKRAEQFATIKKNSDNK